MKYLLYLSAFLFIFSCKNETATTESADTTPATPAMPAVNDTLQQLFEEVNVVKMHLFGTKEMDPKADDYPYTGKMVGEAQLKFLSPDLQPNESGSVYACYRTENYNFYILRVPGKVASSNLVLAKWDDASSQLIKVLDLANIQCEGEKCTQQDAWLTDLDDDRTLELVTRNSTTEKGKVSNESFTVLMQQPPGNFTKAPEDLASLAPQTSYVMNQK